MNEVVEHQSSRAVVSAQTVDEIKARARRIQEVRKALMKKDVHYGIIPGTRKDTLYKAGSEVLLSAFMISVEPEVEDLSNSDEIRYRVRARGIHAPTGTCVGIGVGEASSSEEKYRWRNAVCQEEFDETPEDRRRKKWQKYDGQVGERLQVRTVPADVANTVLKMAKKRAQIDMTLTALAASDTFNQDLEDLSPEVREAIVEGDQKGQSQSDETRGKPATQAPQSNGNGKHATEKQVKLLHARLDNAGVPENAFCKHFGVSSISELSFANVDEALKWIERVNQPS